MKKPFVGVVADMRSEHPGVFVPQNYMDALEDSGALPVTLPFTGNEENIAWLAERFDGYLLTGGADVHPRAYGAPTLTHCGELQPLRDAFELALVPRILAAGKPVLAVCRGLQALNVAMGGALYQDIDALHPRSLPLQHQQKAATQEATHAISVAPGSLLASILGGETVWVNSFHHQAVERVAPGLVATAWAEDGVVEAAEMPGARFVLGVQWHPECMARTDKKSAALFTAFAAACGNV
jgi:putative glutamine amidotransferase